MSQKRLTARKAGFDSSSTGDVPWWRRDDLSVDTVFPHRFHPTGRRVQEK